VTDKAPALREDAPVFRMPGEWERHEATWLGWPHRLTDWPGRFAPIPWVYGEIVRKLAEGETVRVLVLSRPHEAGARRVLARAGADLGRGRVPPLAHRSWLGARLRSDLRASGLRSERRAIARFRFNAWAKYPDWKKDEDVPRLGRAAPRVQAAPVKAKGREVVLEGGSIDVNGAGTLITTEECLMDPVVQVRNPGFTKDDYAAVFRSVLGITNVIWLGKGIAGDDTHGHVDDLCRFVDPRTIVTCRERNGQDANHRALEDNWERLKDARLEDGGRPKVVALPMPAPLVFSGQRLPASYANFYVANAAVLVPTFNDPNDRIALGILSDLVKDRPVVGIHAVDLVWGLGTLHCLTQQEPASL
jgi:agmatine deiminase